QAVAEEEGREHQRAKEARELEIGSGEAAAQMAEAETAESETAAAPAPEVESQTEPRRWGSRQAEIVGARLLDGHGAERYHFASGESVTFEIDVEAHEELANVVFGVGIFTPRGTECFGTNTHLEGFVSSRLAGRATVGLTCESLRLAAGEYLLDVAVHARDGNPYDYHRRLLSFTMTSPGGGVGVYSPEHSWRFDGGIEWQARPEGGGAG
ncbi:MAG: Wzt carbohydrate-binding domain-containing protein, partial [Acidobacteriota bacterium]|nr:Wzt carbohydrate-binding domain-containing protein [Acidobacteriota bacterium]